MIRIPMPKPLHRDNFPSDDAFEAALFSGWHEYASRYHTESEIQNLLVLLNKWDVDYWSVLVAEICTAGWELKSWTVSDGNWYGEFIVNFRNRNAARNRIGLSESGNRVAAAALRAKAEQVAAERLKTENAE